MISNLKKIVPFLFLSSLIVTNAFATQPDCNIGALETLHGREGYWVDSSDNSGQKPHVFWIKGISLEPVRAIPTANDRPDVDGSTLAGDNSSPVLSCGEAALPLLSDYQALFNCFQSETVFGTQRLTASGQAELMSKFDHMDKGAQFFWSRTRVANSGADRTWGFWGGNSRIGAKYTDTYGHVRCVFYK